MRKLKYFDPAWYLSQYPDVAAAGIDPREHFEKHGRREGRLPCFLPSIGLEKSLWARKRERERERERQKNGDTFAHGMDAEGEMHTS